MSIRDLRVDEADVQATRKDVANERLTTIVNQVEAWDAQDSITSTSKSQILELLKTKPAPFSREADREHLTAGAVVISSAGVLMLRHKLFNNWSGPGGHVDGDEYPWQAAQREILEETGIHARCVPMNSANHDNSSDLLVGTPLVGMDVHDTPNGHKHFDLCYYFVADADDPAPPANESQDVEWVPLELAPKKADLASFRRALERAIEFRASQAR